MYGQNDKLYCKLEFLSSFRPLKIEEDLKIGKISLFGFLSDFETVC